MLIRALIVLLFALNLSVAAWWVTRAAPTEAAPPIPPPGVLRLQLATEAPANSGAETPPATPGQGPSAGQLQCASFGPFADAGAAALAREQVLPRAERATVRALPSGPVRAWKVWLPPHETLAEVEAVEQRVAAAGFTDRFVVRQGSDANSLALGRFAREDAAREHAARLIAAGFPALAEPIADGPISHWLDVRARGTDPVKGIQATLDVAEARAFECARSP